MAFRIVLSKQSHSSYIASSREIPWGATFRRSSSRSTPKPSGRSRRQPRSKAGSTRSATLHPQLLEKRQYRKTYSRFLHNKVNLSIKCVLITKVKIIFLESLQQCHNELTVFCHFADIGCICSNPNR